MTRGYVSYGVSVQGVSVQGVSDRGVCVLGVSVRGVHVRGGSVLSPYNRYHMRVLHLVIVFVLADSNPNRLDTYPLPSPLRIDSSQ